MYGRLFIITMVAVAIVLCLSGCNGNLSNMNNNGNADTPTQIMPSSEKPQQSDTGQDNSLSDVVTSTTPEPAAKVEIGVDDGTEIKLTVSDKELTFDGQSPLTKDDEVLVPVYGVFENLLGANGANNAPFKVTWDETASTVTIRNTWYTVVIIEGENSFTCNREKISPNVPPQRINGELMLPLKAIADAISATVEWDETEGMLSMFYESMIMVD